MATGAVAAVLVAALGLVAGCAGSGSAPPAAGRSATGSATAAAAAALPACPAVPRVAARADGLPPLRLPCLGAGPAVRLSDLRGTPMVLNVWAAWCQPCAEEMPRFAALHARLGERVRFFGVHIRAKRDFGLFAAKDFGVFFPSVQDTDGVLTAKALRATAPPQTFFVTADGRVVKHTLGAVGSERELAAQVARYLGVRA